MPHRYRQIPSGLAQIGPRGLRTGQGPAPAVAPGEHLQRQVDQGLHLLRVEVIGSESGEAVFRDLGKEWDGLDGIVHSIAFAGREQLEGSYADAITREGFAMAHDISAYSFAALAKAGREMMQGRNGALVTMTYLGAVRTIPSYNVMGVAKASLEANVRYLADALGPEGT